MSAASIPPSGLTGPERIVAAALRWAATMWADHEDAHAGSVFDGAGMPDLPSSPRTAEQAARLALLDEIHDCQSGLA
jgi:hypothetical protein